MNVRVLTVCGSIQPFSANRAAIEVAHSYMRSRRDVELDDYADLARIRPFNAALDDDPGPVVTAWRKRIGSSDAVLIAAPEYGCARRNDQERPRLDRRFR